MKIIALGRGQGKTHTLIKWLLHDPNGRTLLVSYAQEAKFVMQSIVTYLDSKELTELLEEIDGTISRWDVLRGDGTPLIITVQQLLNMRSAGGNPRTIGVDNVERVMGTILSHSHWSAPGSVGTLTPAETRDTGSDVEFYLPQVHRET